MYDAIDLLVDIQSLTNDCNQHYACIKDNIEQIKDCIQLYQEMNKAENCITESALEMAEEITKELPM